MQFFHHRIMEWGYFFVLQWILYDLSFRILYHADNIHPPTNHYILCIGTHLPSGQIGVQHPQKCDKHRVLTSGNWGDTGMARQL